MNDDRLVKRVYRERRRELRERGKKDKQNWCYWTWKFLKELGMEGVWEGENLGEDRGSFSNLVRKSLEIEEEKFWRNQLQRKSKLRLYRKLKTELRFEEYLIFLNRVKSRNLTLLRGGSPQLRIETGRWRGESEKKDVAMYVSVVQ